MTNEIGQNVFAMTMTKKRWTSAGIVAMIAALGIAYWGYFREDVVRFKAKSWPDERGTVIIVMDDEVLSYSRTKQFVLSNASPDAIKEIRFEKFVKKRYSGKIRRSDMFVIGRNSKDIAIITPKPLALTVICPVGQPPASPITNRDTIAVLLGPNARFSDSNNGWRRWCSANRIPFLELKNLSDGELKRGLTQLNKDSGIP